MTSQNPSAKAQAEYKARLRAKGYRQVPVWVPEDCREMIRDIARKMREGAERRSKQGK